MWTLAAFLSFSSIMCIYFLGNTFKQISNEQFLLKTRIEKMQADIRQMLLYSAESVTDVREDVKPSFDPPKWMDKISDMKLKRNSSNQVKRHDFKELQLVHEPKCSHAFKLIVLVQSKVENFHMRMVVRNTWGRYPNGDKIKWKTFFLVEKSDEREDSFLLRREYEQFDDLLIADTFRGENTASLKIQLGFEWALNNCKMDYLLKVNENTFVNSKNLFSFIQEKRIPKTKLYAGYVIFRGNVLRLGYYKISEEEYPGNTYPRYCSSAGFILTTDVVHKMIDNYRNVFPIKIEDAYIGMLALKSGVDAFHEQKFKVNENCNYSEYKNDQIVHYPIKDKQCMERFYEMHLNGGST